MADKLAFLMWVLAALLLWALSVVYSSPWCLVPWAASILMWVCGQDTVLHCSWWLKFTAYMWLCMIFRWANVWNFMFEIPVKCHHPPLPVNQSGVKILAAGLSKMGTRTIAHALNDIGIRAYHGEDFHHFSGWDFIQREWKKRGPGASDWTVTVGDIVQEMDGQSKADLAEAISRCRLEALAFDGLEEFTWPVLETSPDVKVLIMQWRSYEQWNESLQAFLLKLFVMYCYETGMTQSFSLIPYGIFLRILDPIIGGSIESTYSKAWPPLCETQGPMMYLYRALIHHRRQAMCWRYSEKRPFGTSIVVSSATEFNAYYDRVRAMVPVERRMEFDPRTNSYEDICAFAGVAPCPKKGPLPKAMNTFVFDRDFPFAASMAHSVGLMAHFVNWWLFKAMFSISSRRLFFKRGKLA